MSRIKDYVYKFHHTPKKILIKQVTYKVKGLASYQLYHAYDHLFDTRWNYAETKCLGKPLPLSADGVDLTGFGMQEAAEAWRMYKNHRFDLLGSGWVKNDFSNTANGLDGYRFDSIALSTDEQGSFLSQIMCKRNLNKAQHIWKMIVGPYEGIDWQKDFKSGYRWGAEKWYRPQGNAKETGGDIKVPWELARLQHFPRLAVLALKMPERKEEIFQEYCNQMLDFIAQNPPRMGVNYMCTMDVGIRTANMALAYSLFKSMGMIYEEKVEKVFINFLFEQCNHIRRNLEWSDILTSNHYFADIAGLLYGSAVLPECKKKDKWLSFAVEQIKREIVKQFYEEGTNAEGSSAYHRLTGEMAVYSVALIHFLSKNGVCEDAPQEIYRILYGAGQFIHDITRPDGSFTQIGDNDSGLFFRLSFTGQLLAPGEAIQKYYNLSTYNSDQEDVWYLDENLNDGRPFVAAVYGMTGREDLQQEGQIYPLEYSLVKQLMGEESIKTESYKRIIETEEGFDRKKLGHQDSVCFLSKESCLLDGLERITYPKFGIYLYKSPCLYLCINGTDNGQKGNAGHAHNDKLSFELFMNGECICQDSGTYVYTALPEERNRFRSVQMHNTIDTGEEQNEYMNLFAMKSRTVCTCLEWEERICTMQVSYGKVVHIRRFILDRNQIKIEDFCNQSFEENMIQMERTCGYGKKINESYGH